MRPTKMMLLFAHRWQQLIAALAVRGPFITRRQDMGMSDEWLDLEVDLQTAIIVACERQGLDQNLARLIATDALIECRGRARKRMQFATREEPTSKQNSPPGQSGT
jgi:hypothetical protein